MRCKSAESLSRITDYEVLEFQPLTIGKHTGYRIDIGQAAPLYMQLDGVTTQMALRRTSQVLFCSPLARDCLHTTRCEALVRGRAFYTFRGVMKIAGNEVTVSGDRRIAGPFCNQAERVMLGWPQT